MAVNHHLRLALDQVSDAVIVVENGPLPAPGPKILYANEAMAEATGVPASGLCDVPLGALCEGDVLLRMLIALTDSAAGAVETPAPLNHLRGTPTPCRWSARPPPGARGERGRNRFHKPCSRALTLRSSTSAVALSASPTISSALAPSSCTAAAGTPLMAAKSQKSPGCI